MKELVSRKSVFLQGVKQGIPIALGYIPIAITFGLLATSADIPHYIIILMSIMVFAGASQFVAINLLALQTSGWEVIITTFMVNLRHLLMSASLAPKLESNLTKKIKALLAFGITDETFSLASLSKKDTLPANFMLGLSSIAYSSWVSGTIVGVLLGSQLPAVLQNSMGIALYAMFLGLLIPEIKKSKPLFTVSLLAIGCNSLFYWCPVFSFLSQAWRIIITTVLASSLGVILFPKEEEN